MPRSRSRLDFGLFTLYALCTIACWWEAHDDHVDGFSHRHGPIMTSTHRISPSLLSRQDRRHLYVSKLEQHIYGPVRAVRRSFIRHRCAVTAAWQRRTEPGPAARSTTGPPESLHHGVVNTPFCRYTTPLTVVT